MPTCTSLCSPPHDSLFPTCRHVATTFTMVQQRKRMTIESPTLAGKNWLSRSARASSVGADPNIDSPDPSNDSPSGGGGTGVSAAAVQTPCRIGMSNSEVEGCPGQEAQVWTNSNARAESSVVQRRKIFGGMGGSSTSAQMSRDSD